MDELVLVDRVELKLLQAASDHAFTQSLALYLCPLLQKLKSPRIEVVSKVLDLIRKLKLRLNPSVDLPTEKLVNLYETTVRDTSLAVLRQNSQVLSLLIHDRNINYKYTTSLATGLNNLLAENNEYAIKNAISQFYLFLKCLVSYDFKAEDPIAINDNDRPVVENLICKLFFVDFKHQSPLQNPGLSRNEAEFFDQLLKVGDDIVLAKVWKSCLDMAVRAPEVWQWLLLAASGCGHLDIAREAWSATVKLCHDSDTYPIDKLLSWALGGGGIRPVDIDLRANIVDILGRKKCSLADPKMGQLVNMAFRSSDEVLRRNTLQLLRNGASTISPVNQELFIKILKQYLMDNGWPRSNNHSPKLVLQRQQVYETLGVICRTEEPTVDTLPIVQFILQSLERDSADMAASIQKSVSDALESLTAQAALELKPKLLGYMTSSDNDRTQYVAVRFAVHKIPPSEVTGRLICLLGLNARPDVADEARRGLASTTVPPLAEMIAALSSKIWPLKTVSGASEALGFLVKCLTAEIGGVVEETGTAIKYDPATQKALEEYAVQSPDVVKDLLLLCYSVFKTFPLEHSSIASDLWLSLVKHSPQSIVQSNFTSEQIGLLLTTQYKTLAAETLTLLPTPDISVVIESPGGYLAAAFLSTSLILAGKAVDPDTFDKILQWSVDKKDFEVLYALCLSGKIKVTEKILQIASKDELCLASLSLSDQEGIQQYAEKLMSKSDFKGFDDMLVNGEAVSLLVSGYNSAYLHQKQPLLRFPTSSAHDNLDLILKKLSVKTVPLKRITSVRLLCLVQYNLDELTRQNKTELIQAVLLNLLNDGDEITQESASRALGILYEHGDRSMQKTLMDDLVGNLTAESSTNRNKVTDETQLFEPGMLKTGENTSISTYKDVLSLASEVGDNTLVYKFMSLAASSQVWNSRRGAAFGLERIVARSQLSRDIAQGDKKGKALVPKLYRYLYDPNEKVQRSMRAIWDSLIKDSHATIANYIPETVSELLKGCIHREWRTREAAALAMANLVQTQWDNLSQFLGEIWVSSFRVVDDIKESVRVAGAELTKALATVLIRRLEKKDASSQQIDVKLLGDLVPFLLGTRGLQSNSDDVRKSALDTLLKIIKIGSVSFVPYSLDVFSELVLLLSVLEPQAMNYIALNAANYGVTASAVDQTRARAMKHSPIMEVLETMAERFENEELDKLITTVLPRLVKQAVGLPSKLCVSRLIILVCMRFPRDYSFDALFSASTDQLWGINDVICQSYAECNGYIARHQSIENVVSYVSLLRKTFASAESDDTRKRHIIGLALNGLSRHASDQFSKISSTALPLAFVGQYDSSENVATVFKDVWATNTGGKASIKLYRREILDFALPLLQSGSRELQKTAATAISEVVEAYAEPESELLTTLMSNLAGRSWPGKEYIFRAFIGTAAQVDTVSDETLSRITNEVQRKNVDYKLAILPSVGPFLKSHPSGSLSEIYLSAVKEILVDDEHSADDKVAIFEGAMKSELNSPELFELYRYVLDHWKLKISACDSLAAYGTRGIFDNDAWQLVSKKCANDEGHEKVREAWARAAVALSRFVNSDDVLQLAKNEKSSVVLKELRKSYSL